MAFINGVVFGLTLSVLLGPVFFTLLQTSLEKGFEKAVIVAAGVSLADIVIIALVYLGLSQLLNFEEHKQTIAYIGSVILFVFGVAAMLKSKRPLIKKDVRESPKGFFRFLIKGFLINAFSPFVPIFWVGTMSLATVKYAYQELTLFVFFATIVLVVFCSDVIKALLAQKLNSFINARVMKIMNVLVGIILMLFALRMATYY